MSTLSPSLHFRCDSINATSQDSLWVLELSAAGERAELITIQHWAFQMAALQSEQQQFKS